MAPPNYQEYQVSKVVYVSPEEGVNIEVIARKYYGAKNPVMTRTPTTVINFKLTKGKSIEQIILKECTDFIFTPQRSTLFGGGKHKSDAHRTLVLTENGGTYVPIELSSDDCHFVIIVGLPICKPIVQHAPFVMNTQQEIYQAFHDYS